MQTETGLENHIRFLVSFWGVLAENQISSRGFDFRFVISQIMLYSEAVIEENQVAATIMATWKKARARR